MKRFLDVLTTPAGGQESIYDTEELFQETVNNAKRTDLEPVCCCRM